MMNKDDNNDPTAEMQARLISNDALGVGDTSTSTSTNPFNNEDNVDAAGGGGVDEEQQNLTIEVHDQVERGEKQPNKYRDAPFAILFVIHLVVIFYFAFAWGLPAALDSSQYENDNTDNTTDDDSMMPEHLNISGILGLLSLCSVAGLVLLAATMAIMIRCAEQVIQFSLVFSIVVSLLFAVGFAMEHLIVMSVLYFVVGAVGVCYAYVVWRRIPFARANLKTALTAVQTNLGVTAVAFGMVVVFIVWSVLWMLAYLGIYRHNMEHCHGKQDECDQDSVNGLNGMAGLFFILSFYWTSEVIKNVLHVTTAGIVGTWWLVPSEASSYCSTAITDSFSRSVSYSFGSICMGSLLMAIIRALRYFIHQARTSNQRNTILLCILECLVACLEGIVEFFNRFAFIYVGLYGYDFLTSGRRVINLFQQRGWTTIINDNLVHRALMLMCLVVGGLTGCVGMLVAYIAPSWVDAFGENTYIFSFFLAFLIGTAMAHVVFGVVASATDTVVVCFAESPNDFQSNHPELSQEMLLAWRQIYPSEFGL